VANKQQQYQSRPAQPGKFQQPPFCGICSGRATTEVLYEMENVVVKQVYCDECVPTKAQE
jgi:hypothetical protein